MSEPLHFLPEARRLLAEISAAGDTPMLGLTGDLGFGKTSFAKTLLFEGWGFDPARVQSPTFLKLLEYEVPGLGRALHVDGYRVENPDEWERVGLEAYADSALWIVEWPDTLLAYLNERPALASLLGFRGWWDLRFEMAAAPSQGKVGPVHGPLGGGGGQDLGWGAPLRRLGWRRKSSFVKED